VNVPCADTSQLTDNLVVGIRPEKLFVKREPIPTNGGVMLEGHMEEITFLGQLLRFHITFGESMMIVDDFGGVNRALRYQKADKVYMEINPKDCLLMPEHGETL